MVLAAWGVVVELVMVGAEVVVVAVAAAVVVVVVVVALMNLLLVSTLCSQDVWLACEIIPNHNKIQI